MKGGELFVNDPLSSNNQPQWYPPISTVWCPLMPRNSLLLEDTLKHDQQHCSIWLSGCVLIFLWTTTKINPLFSAHHSIIALVRKVIRLIFSGAPDTLTSLSLLFAMFPSAISSPLQLIISYSYYCNFWQFAHSIVWFIAGWWSLKAWKRTSWWTAPSQTVKHSEHLNSRFSGDTRSKSASLKTK